MNTSGTPGQALDQTDGAEVSAREEVEREKNALQEQARKLLDENAIASLEQTWRAIQALTNNRFAEARGALAEALAKLGAARNDHPEVASVPVTLKVEVVDTAPRGREQVLDLADEAAIALAKKIYPEAREALEQLRSEIRVRTVNLPLQTFQDYLNNAARSLDNSMHTQAKEALERAPASLIAAERIVPIPLILAREAMRQIQERQCSEKTQGLAFLRRAEQELQRAKDLGYATNSERFTELSNQLKQLRKQLR